MALFILRRLGQAILTILGVMIITFLLFRVVSGDIAGANLGEKATARDKAVWRHNHGYDLPTVFNVDDRLLLTDTTVPQAKNAPSLQVKDSSGSQAVEVLELVPGDLSDADAKLGSKRQNTSVGRYISWGFDRQTQIGALTGKKPLVEKLKPATATPLAEPSTASEPAAEPAVASTPATEAPQETEPLPAKPSMIFVLGDGSKIVVDVTDVATGGDLIDRVNNAPGNDGKLVAGIKKWQAAGIVDSQFFHHLWNSITFQSRSLKDNRKLTEIIIKHGPYSLALTIPSMVIEWMLGLIVACFVAYYRSTWIDKLGVFVTVLGMCIPFLAFMILGQWVVFQLWPAHAYGVYYRSNLYVPIAIMVISGVGGMVRFYRTVILDETGRDYVRTARAKGLPLPAILFKHVLRNCMLPILTSLIMTIPFLIMGSLLVESYFGIPGLGDLMLTSIQDRNEPIMNGMVLLTAVIYTVGILLTDISYAIFDPRIRLK